MNGDLASFALVAVAATIAFVLVPLILLPTPKGARSVLDVLVINFLRWFGIVIVGSHVFAAVGMYGRVNVLMGIMALVWLAVFRREGGGKMNLVHRLHLTGGEGVPHKPVVARIAVGLPFAALMAASYGLRARDTFGNLTLPHADAYIHMTWATSFPSNNLWPDGIYPQGLAAFVAFIDIFAPFTHILDVARFTGPLVATLIVFAIYFAVSRLTRSPGAALVAAGAFGIFGALPDWRLAWGRQVGLLSQEFALAIALLALPLAVRAVTDRNGGRYLWIGPRGGIRLGGQTLTIAAAGFAVAMTHPIPAGVYLLLAGGGIVVAAAVVGQRWRHALGALVGLTVGTVVGLAVVPLAVALGGEPYAGHTAADLFASSAEPIAERYAALVVHFLDRPDLITHGWLSVVSGIGALIGLAAATVLLVRRGSRIAAAELLALAVIALAVVAMWDLRPFLAFLDPFYIIRLSMVMGPLIALGIGAGAGVIHLLLGRVEPGLREAASSLTGIAIIGLMLALLPGPVSTIEERYTRDTIEYEETAQVVRDLRLQHERRTYTVVGVTNQRQTLAGDAFFIELWVFARDIDGVEPTEPVPVPTRQTFVFVELDPFPVPELDVASPTEEYYFSRDKRGRIMARVYEWAEKRRRLDPDTTVYYDGDHVRVYRIARGPSVEIDWESPLFKDYGYQPDALFNDGPTSPRDVDLSEVIAP